MTVDLKGPREPGSKYQGAGPPDHPGEHLILWESSSAELLEPGLETARDNFRAHDKDGPSEHAVPIRRPGEKEGEETGQRATRGYWGGNQVRFSCSRGESRRKERGGPHQEGISSGPAMRAMPSHRVLLDGCMSDCAGRLTAFVRVAWSWGV